MRLSCWQIWPPEAVRHCQMRSKKASRPKALRLWAFGLQLAFHQHLRCDAGVVCADLPEGVGAEHAVIADEDINEGVLKGVPHVQVAGDIGWRDDNAIRRPLAGWRKVAGLFPLVVEGFLILCGSYFSSISQWTIGCLAEAFKRLGC